MYFPFFIVHDRQCTHHKLFLFYFVQLKPTSRPVLENAAQLAEMDTVSLLSVSSFGDEDEEIDSTNSTDE